MGNCLVTKLSGVVDNDNLIKLGSVKVNYDGNGQLRLRFTEQKTAIIHGSGYFSDSTYTENRGKTATVNANTDATLYIVTTQGCMVEVNDVPYDSVFSISPAGNGYIDYSEISEYRHIKAFDLLSVSAADINKCHIDISKIAYPEDLTLFGPGDYNTNIDISDLSIFTNLTGLYLYGKETGNIGNINLQKLGDTNIKSPNIYGRVEDFIEAVSGGSGRLGAMLSLVGTSCTLNNKLYNVAARWTNLTDGGEPTNVIRIYINNDKTNLIAKCDDGTWTYYGNFQ